VISFPIWIILLLIFYGVKKIIDQIFNNIKEESKEYSEGGEKTTLSLESIHLNLIEDGYQLLCDKYNIFPEDLFDLDVFVFEESEHIKHLQGRYFSNYGFGFDENIYLEEFDFDKGVLWLGCIDAIKEEYVRLRSYSNDPYLTRFEIIDNNLLITIPEGKKKTQLTIFRN
jgi:hypothetical protein